AINIMGYAVAVAFMVAVISIAQSYNLAAVGMLKSTGTHFMAFIPESQPCCEGQFVDGGPCAEGVYTSIIDTSALKRIKDIPGVRDAAPYLPFKMYHDSYKAFPDTPVEERFENAVVVMNRAIGSLGSA
ncbi:unnamed protein product, partial [marine sediment metagenome]